jgi:hypothetical protein
MRIQRRRSKGWRLPPNTICVTRPGKWSNPFRVGGWFRWQPEDRLCPWQEASCAGTPGFTCIEDNAMAVAWFDRLFQFEKTDLAPLRGKDLACWCRPGEPCHADVLLKRANGPDAN